jgi:hypothetical protein
MPVRLLSFKYDAMVLAFCLALNSLKSGVSSKTDWARESRHVETLQ